MRTLAEGRHLSNMVLSFVKTGAASKPFLTYEFEEVVVTSLQDSASGEVPVEAVSFAYEEVIVTYSEQGLKGSTGKTERFGWDLRRNDPV